MRSTFSTKNIYVHWVKCKVLITFLFIFLFTFNVRANHINYYQVLLAYVTAVSPQKVITTTATPASSQLYVTVGFGPSVSTGRNIITLTKTDFAGNCSLATVYKIASMPNADLNAKSIAEDFNPSNPKGYVIVGDYINYATGGSTGHFAMKINAAGTSVIWTTTWADNMGVKSVIISHDPNNFSHVYVVCQSSAASVSWPVIYHLNPATGVLTGTHVLKHPNGFIANVRDAIEVYGTATPTLKGYFLVCDINAQAAFAFVPWFTWPGPLPTYSYYTIPNVAGCTNVAMAALTKMDSMGGPVQIIATGSCFVPGMGTRPYMVELHIANMTSFPYLVTPIIIPSLTTSDIIQPTGIVLVKPQAVGKPNSVLVTFNHNGPSVVNSGMFSINVANLGLGVGNTFSIHTPSGLYKYFYGSITSTYNKSNFIAIGAALTSPTATSCTMMSRVNFDGTLSPAKCFNPLPMNASPIPASVTAQTAAFAFTKTSVTVTGNATIGDYGIVTVCGNTPQIGGIIPGPFAVNYNNTFKTNSVMNADYDADAEEAVFATTKLVSSANTMYLNTINTAAFYNLEAIYPNSGKDEALATKKAANGDIIIAGRTSLSSGDVVVYIHRTDEMGNTLWYKYYDQGTTQIGTNINITETKITGDIVVIASSNTGSNDVIMMRTDANGVLEYYDDHAVYAGTNTSETAPYIRGLTATSDDGYAVCGTTGQNGDYFGALIIKCDGSYSGTHTNDWSYVHRHLLASGYDLTDPAKRSSSFANAVTEDASGNLWVAGSTSNCDQNGLNATYQNGLLIELQANGTVVATNAYADASSSFIAYNGLSMSGSNVMLTGYSQDPSSGATKTTLSQVDASTYGMNWTTEYGTNTVNMGTSVFTTSTGYMIVGVSNDNTSATAPIVIMTDLSGATGCQLSMTLNGATDDNDPVSISIGSSTSATETALTITEDEDNESCTNVCGSSTGGLKPMLTAGTTTIPTDAKKINAISAYPNPTNGKISIKLNANVNANGVITVSDVQGRVVYTSTVSISNKSNIFEVDMTGFAGGVYILKVQDDKGSVYPVCNINKL